MKKTSPIIYVVVTLLVAKGILGLLQGLQMPAEVGEDLRATTAEFTKVAKIIFGILYLVVGGFIARRKKWAYITALILVIGSIAFYFLAFNIYALKVPQCIASIVILALLTIRKKDFV